MKTKIKATKFDTVKVFREIKEKIASDMNGMSFDQIKEYLKSNSLKLNNQ